MSEFKVGDLVRVINLNPEHPYLDEMGRLFFVETIPTGSYRNDLIWVTDTTTQRRMGWLSEHLEIVNPAEILGEEYFT